MDAGIVVDSGTPGSDAGVVDSGVVDTGVVDTGVVDAGSPSPDPQIVLQLRDLDMNVFGSDAVGSVILARPDAVIPASGCVQHVNSQVNLPRFGTISAQGVTVTELVCVADTAGGIDGIRCLGQGAAPPPIPGSTLDTGPWLMGSDVTLAVAGGADLGALQGVLTPPAVAAELIAPTALPASDADLTVQWMPLGHTDLQIEVEVMVGGSPGLVICVPDSDGQVVVPQALLGDSMRRLSIANFVEQVVRDGDDRGLRLQVMRGQVLAQ